MGQNFADQYSFLHFCVGAIAYFWGVPWEWWFIAHTLFEVLENTTVGIKLINRFPIWPGGKPNADSFVNSLGDTVFAMLGWFAAYAIDQLGNHYGWYKKHL